MCIRDSSCLVQRQAAVLHGVVGVEDVGHEVAGAGAAAAVLDDDAEGDLSVLCLLYTSSQPDDRCRHGKALLLQDADGHAAAHTAAQTHQRCV